MAYVEHEWVNGETITAAKMNNIEEGIVEASQSGGGGGGNPIIFLTKDLYSGDHYLVFAICTYDSGEDVYYAGLNIPEDQVAIDVNIGGYTGSGYMISPLPIPPEGYYLVVFGLNTWTYELSGDIGTELVTIDIGTIRQGYIITGNCYISISGQ
jgi:hypothetical protein